MIPASWEPRHRADGELVGYLVAAGDGVVATSLIGLALAGATSREAAIDLLDTSGLAVLDRPYYARLPNPVPLGGVDAGAPAADWTWRRVVIVESSATRVSIRPAMAYPEELRSLVVIEPPVTGTLRERHPEE
ncbi:hypothetical protein F1C58_15195 [Glaciihabitans sp. INWT7]|uniref:hypothetical protein n=1 Tax=Glaciihabitans sp. INWT7 TaxID=2596912 RepID=UPI0016251744|nr:hypothetical protein [Glaciihabitans sp. INWT7]QNE48110.1 hypothetical protein F1C58_15195 [Glaciihabitans sp. INWT7]